MYEVCCYISAISATNCDPNSGDNAACEDVSTDAVCDSTASKCMCKAGYSPDPDTENGCLKGKVS